MGRASKDKRDVYYRKAKVLGYRARSAFKLAALDEEFGLLDAAANIVDLCAAPGSWSQYIARRLRELRREREATVVAIDLQAIAPIDGIVMLQRDITRPETVREVLRIFDGKSADIVVSDGAPDVTGLHDLDEYVQASLVLAALNFALCMLRPGGAFVAKVFRCRDTHLLYDQLRVFFKDVVISKPRSSRNSSVEAFVVCRDYTPVEGYVPAILSPNPNLNAEVEVLSEVNRTVVPFVAAGDLSGFDADMSYSVDAGEEGLAPVAPPVAPPYAAALEKLRGEGHGKKNSTKCDGDEGCADRDDEVRNGSGTVGRSTTDLSRLKI
jgi:tRNA (cytidine32/guanosine34-2'-O)-methyltransferase